MITFKYEDILFDFHIGVYLRNKNSIGLGSPDEVAPLASDNRIACSKANWR